MFPHTCLLCRKAIRKYIMSEVITDQINEIDELSTAVETHALESFRLTNEALARSFGSLSVSLESHDGDGLISRIKEAVKAFFEKVRKLIDRIIDFFKSDVNKKEETIQDIKDFESKNKGRDKVNISDENVATEDFATFVEQETAEYKILKLARDNFVTRKKALWLATNKICETRTFFAAKFLHKGREVKEFIDTATVGTVELVKLSNALYAEINKTSELSRSIELIAEYKEKFRRVSADMFNENDPIKGVQQFTSKLDERIRFQQVPTEDLVVMVGDVLFSSVSIENDLIAALASLQKTVDGIKEMELIERSQYYKGEKVPQEAEDYYRSLIDAQRMVIQSISVLRHFMRNLQIPEQYFTLVQATMNAQESVVERLKTITPHRSNLDERASKLFEKMLKEF